MQTRHLYEALRMLRIDCEVVVHYGFSMSGEKEENEQFCAIHDVYLQEFMPVDPAGAESLARPILRLVLDTTGHLGERAQHGSDG